MRIELHHCLLLILLIAVAQALVSGSTRSININSGSDDNCTREGEVIICPCNVTINGTYYPCWQPINNGTIPNITCTDCPPGSFSNAKTENCTDVCPIGTCLEPYRCDYCPPGHFSNETGSSECKSCPAGYSARDLGSQNCTACPPGFTAADGSASCVGCIAGEFAANYGSPFCEVCDFGSYSVGKSDSCPKCRKGTYNDKRGQGFCIGCGQGFYGNAMGLTLHTQCILCPAGSYCPDPDTVLPVTCPRDHFCASGSPLPLKCSLLYQSDQGMEACQPGVGFYIVIFGSIGIAGIFFAVVWRWRAVKQERIRREYRQTEIDRLIPKPRDGPVYTGF